MERLWLRLATPGYLRFLQSKQFDATFGGGEANVAVSLANYGLDAEFVTRFPKNDIAASCIKDLHSYGVCTKHCVFGGDRLGIYFLWKYGKSASEVMPELVAGCDVILGCFISLHKKGKLTNPDEEAKLEE